MMSSVSIPYWQMKSEMTYVLVGIVINNKNISAAFHLKLHL